ncbi:MAG: FN3 associated domain-containing protein [Polyangiaceae bacterium]
MTRRLGGPNKGLAAIASLSLAVTLAWAGAMTGCGSSSGGSGTPTVDSGNDVGSSGGQIDSGEDAFMVPETSTPPVDAGMEAAPVLPVLVAPTFMPPTGTALNGPTNVTIVPPAGFPANGFIYYTTNGTNPNPNSLVYVGPIQVSQAETIRAYASAPGYTDSPISFATYTIAMPEGGTGDGGPPPALTEPGLSPTSSAPNNDFKVSAAAPNGATVCYTLDGVTTPTCNAAGACTGSSLPYNSVAQIAINGSVTSSTGSVTVQAIACAAGSPNSAVASQTYVLTVAPPSFTNPAPGTVLLGVTPIVSSTTSGATIGYTKTGAAPTCINGTVGVGTGVSDPHTFQNAAGQTDGLVASTTYQTIGCKTGYAPSTVSTSTFTVQLNPLTMPPFGTGAGQEGPGTYDNFVGGIQLGDSANHTAGYGLPGGTNEWACYTLDGTAPACGATAGTCSANVPTTGCPAGNGCGIISAPSTTATNNDTSGNGTITKTGTTLTVVDCATGYTASTTVAGAYTLQLDPIDLNLPGAQGEVAANGTCTPNVFGPQVPTFAIPSNLVGMLTAHLEQDGNGVVFSFACVSKGGTPQCGASGCAAGTELSLFGDFDQCDNGDAIIPQTGSIAAGDSWSVIACPSATDPDHGLGFAPSTVSTVSYTAPGTASPPQISPGGSTLTSTLLPVITNTDTTAGGSTICFTEDGTTPTCTTGTCGNATTGTTYSCSLDPSGGATVPDGGISIGLAGTGYTTAPAITLTGGGASTEATAAATLMITGYTNLVGGSGYSASDDDFTCIQVFDATGGGSGGFMDAILTGGAISSLVFDDGCGATNGGHGDNYIAPYVTLPGPVAAGTQATVTITGSVDVINVTSNGAGYSTPPTVTLSGGGGGAGATATAVTTNSCQPEPGYGDASGGSALHSNILDTTGNTLTATACNASEMAPTAVSATYTFSIAQPDFTSPGSPTGNLNTATTISAGNTVVVTTASNFVGEVINISYGSTAVNCGTGVTQPTASTDGLPATANGGSATTNGDGSVTIVVPGGVANFTINAVVCGSATTLQNTSPPRSAAFESVTTATPTLQTNQVVPVATVAGCQTAPCPPVSPWYNMFNVILSDVTPGNTICYSTTGTPSCNAGGTACQTGLTYTQGATGFQIASSPITVAAVACAPTTLQSGSVSTPFTLEVSPVVAFAPGSSCGDGLDLQFQPSGATQVSDAVAASGGATLGAVICYTTDNSAPSCATGGSTTCSTPTTGNTSAVDPTVSLTGINIVPAGAFTLTYTACLNGFEPASGSQPVTSGAYRHVGTITLDGVLTDWNTSAEEVDGDELFTYDGTYLYFAVPSYEPSDTNVAVVIYVGNGNDATGAPNGTTNYGAPGLGGEGALYQIAWLTNPGTAAPTVQQWTNGSGWAATSIAVADGFSVPNKQAEFRVPISSLPALGTPPTTIVVDFYEVFEVGTPGAVADEYGDPFDVNYASCLDPNQQLF